MAARRPIRRPAVRESSNPYPIRRQAHKTADRQPSEASDINSPDDPFRTLAASAGPSTPAKRVEFAVTGSSEPALGRLGTQGNPIDLTSDSEHDTDVEVYCDGVEVVRQAPVLTRDCAVCEDAHHIADLPLLSSCRHQAETCADCFARWIDAELTAKGWKGITCPGINCSVTLAHHEVQQYATAETFAQYDLFAMRDALGQVPNFRWCRNAQCKSGQIHDENGYIFTCVGCGHKVCITHDVDWHEGETCDEYTYRVRDAEERELKAQEEEASIDAINQLTKKCPGPGCAFNIQKDLGCDHMTCSQCGYEFCWVCLGDYERILVFGNAYHGQDCRHHTSHIV